MTVLSKTEAATVLTRQACLAVERLTRPSPRECQSASDRSARLRGSACAGRDAIRCSGRELLVNADKAFDLCKLNELGPSRRSSKVHVLLRHSSPMAMMDI